MASKQKSRSPVGRRASKLVTVTRNKVSDWCDDDGAILQKWVPYSQRYLVLGLVGLVGLVGLALWLVSGIALNKYRTVVNKAPTSALAVKFSCLVSP